MEDEDEEKPPHLATGDYRKHIPVIMDSQDTLNYQRY